MDNVTNNDNSQLNNIVEPTTTPKYVDQFGNPIDPSLIDAEGNYIGNTVKYVDQFGNPIDPSLIDDSGNYIGNVINSDQINETGAVSKPVLDQSELANTLKSIQEANINNINDSYGRESVFKNVSDDEIVQYDFNNIPITDIVNQIILDAIKKKASDIHFDPYADGIKIRIRIDGVLRDYSVVPLFVKKNLITRIKIISGLNITESRVPQDGAIRTMLNGNSIDLRVSCLPTNLGEKVVLRIMDYTMSNEGIETLDFTEQNMNKVQRMLNLPNGIILVTGATGSGKSTTVYSMLQKLNREETNIITVEDPIEMSIPGINQVQAQAEIGLDFATVLRSILRQDPDVIMIGEIRDDETARIAVRASITGHLVLSTIHTNNSLATIERLTDMSVERYLLGTSLAGIISQKLVRRLCDNCKKSVRASKYERLIFKTALGQEVDRIYKPVGCPECDHGYKGRLAVHEVLYLTQDIKDAITGGISKEQLRQAVYGGDNATTTLLQDGLLKVLDAKTSFEEIMKMIDIDDDLGIDILAGHEQIEEHQELGTTITDSDMDEVDIFDTLYDDEDDILPDFEMETIENLGNDENESIGDIVYKINKLNQKINELSDLESLDNDDIELYTDEELEDLQKEEERKRLEEEKIKEEQRLKELQEKQKEEKERKEKLKLNPKYLPNKKKNIVSKKVKEIKELTDEDLKILYNDTEPEKDDFRILENDNNFKIDLEFIDDLKKETDKFDEKIQYIDDLDNSMMDDNEFTFVDDLKEDKDYDNTEYLSKLLKDINKLNFIDEDEITNDDFEIIENDKNKYDIDE